MLSVILLSVLIILLSILSGIWSVATAWIGFCTWIWSTRHCGHVFLLRLLCISTNLPYAHVWNTVITYGLLVLHLLLLLNPWLIFEMWLSKVFSIGITLVDVLQNWLNWFHFLFLKGLLVIQIDCVIFLSPFLDVKGCLCQQVLSSHSYSGNLCL